MSDQFSMVRSLLLLSLVAALCLATARADCSIPGRPSCVCKTDTGVIDLTSIAGIDSPKFTEIKDSRVGQDFTYSYNPCYSFTDGDRCENVAGCQIAPDGNYGLGTSDTEILVYEEPNAYLQYSDGLEGRTMHVNLICDKTREEPHLEAMGDSSALLYEFNLYTKCACPGVCPPADGGVAPGVVGIVLILLAVVAFVVYFVTGSVVMAVHYKKKGSEIIPNKQYWMDFPFLVKDGVMFLLAPVIAAVKRDKSQSYESIK